MSIARELGMSLSPGYLFRATNHQGHIVDQALLSYAANFRHLRDANIDNGETLHRFCSGCALTLAFSDSPLADVRLI